MKAKFKFLGISLVALVIIIVTGCNRPSNSAAPGPPAVDPLAGWKMVLDAQPDATINKDSKDYIQKLSLTSRDFVMSSSLYEDASGEHALDIQIGVDGTWWHHILFYDKNDKRVKVIKFTSGGYRS